MSVGAEVIAAERARQVAKEGWTPEHDDEHARGELLMAAIAYVQAARVMPEVDASGAWFPDQAGWPWDCDSWKPGGGDPVRCLAKAGALIAAEIDRLERAS